MPEDNVEYLRPNEDVELPYGAVVTPEYETIEFTEDEATLYGVGLMNLVRSCLEIKDHVSRVEQDIPIETKLLLSRIFTYAVAFQELIDIQAAKAGHTSSVL